MPSPLKPTIEREHKTAPSPTSHAPEPATAAPVKTEKVNLEEAMASQHELIAKLDSDREAARLKLDQLIQQHNRTK